VYLTIELANANDLILNLKHDGHFNFSAEDPDKIQCELHLELFGAIDVEVFVITDKCHIPVPFPSLHDYLDTGYFCRGARWLSLRGRYAILIKKAESNWWPRLFNNDGKKPLFLKVDLDKWQDEDDKNTGPKFSSTNMRW
jgi:hypothetical protein